MMKLVLASNNRGKLAELQALFAGLDMVLISQSSLGVTEAEAVSYTHLRAHETPEHLVCRLLLDKKN